MAQRCHKLDIVLFIIIVLLQQGFGYVDLSTLQSPVSLTEDDFVRPSKIHCPKTTQGSPVALGALAGVRRRKGESRDEALKRLGKTGKEDSSVFNPQKHLLRFNRKYSKIRDQFFFQNDGQTMRFQFEENFTSDATVRGENWDDEYVFAYGQIQWAGDFSKKIGGGGAGHSINSYTYPAEIEMVHYRQSDGNLQNAWSKNGVLIISILLRLVAEGIPALTPLFGNAPFIAQPGPMKLLHAPVNFRQLFPLGDGYFEYTGSNTFPPCNGNVRRIVFETPIEVDDNQLYNLQFLIYADKTSMVNNFSPIQDLGGRKVVYNSEGFKVTKVNKLLKEERPERKDHTHWKLG